MDNPKLHALRSKLAKCKLSEREAILAEIAREAANAPVTISTPSSVEQTASITPAPIQSNQDQTFRIIKTQLDAAVKKNDEKGILDFGRLWVDATLQDERTRRDMGRITERSAVEDALGIYADCYSSIVVANFDTAFAMRDFVARFGDRVDDIVRYFGRELIPEVYPCETVEDHIAELRRYTPAKGSRFVELRTLVQDQISYWSSIPDMILTRQFIRLAGRIDKVESQLAAGRADCLSDSDLHVMGQRLGEMFARDFQPNPPTWKEDISDRIPDLILCEVTNQNSFYEGDLHAWRSATKRRQLAQQFLRLLQIASSETWFPAAQSLVNQFPECMTAIMAGADREDIIDRFIEGGAAAYPMPTPL